MDRLKLSGGVAGRGTESTDREDLGSRRSCHTTPREPLGPRGAHGVFLAWAFCSGTASTPTAASTMFLRLKGNLGGRPNPSVLGKPSRPYLNASGQSDGNYCWPWDNSMYGRKGSFPFRLAEKVAQRVRSLFRLVGASLRAGLNGGLAEAIVVDRLPIEGACWHRNGRRGRGNVRVVS